MSGAPSRWLKPSGSSRRQAGDLCATSGDKAKTDDIYHANKAKIPDKAHLLVGIQLVIPGVSATGK